jgi:CheY-like chemotaxis protein
MSRMLQRFGHDVSQAENGSIALDMLRERQFKNEKQFDILFLDKYVALHNDCSR